MARRLIAKNHLIDVFISSPAKRAKTTAQLFATAYGKLTDEIVYIDELYHAPAKTYFEVIKNLPDDIKNTAIFSHNPGITNFVNMLTQVQVDNMPTCAVFAVRCNKSWKDFKDAEKEFLFFDWPKNG